MKFFGGIELKQIIIHTEKPTFRIRITDPKVIEKLHGKLAISKIKNTELFQLWTIENFKALENKETGLVEPTECTLVYNPDITVFKENLEGVKLEFEKMLR